MWYFQGFLVAYRDVISYNTFQFPLQYSNISFTWNGNSCYTRHSECWIKSITVRNTWKFEAEKIVNGNAILSWVIYCLIYSFKGPSIPSNPIFITFNEGGRFTEYWTLNTELWISIILEQHKHSNIVTAIFWQRL